MNDPFHTLVDPTNMGEMADADAVGTSGNPDCGDMVRMWLKYKIIDGKKVIDKATFQSFGCQTALAVASAATHLIHGKTKTEALLLSASDLAAPAGTLPPVKMHCGEMVQNALRQALADDHKQPATHSTTTHSGPTLLDNIHTPPTNKIRIILQPPPTA